MPFKSLAQRRKFYALAKEGKISEDTVKEWEAHTQAQGKRLPEYSRKPEIRRVKRVKTI